MRVEAIVSSWDTRAVGSVQTLSEVERRVVALWAADCAEHVLQLFETEAPLDAGPRELIARARAFACGEMDVAGEIRRRFVGTGSARAVSTPAAVAAARAAGQAPGVAHMGAHALGAAAYAARARGLSCPERPEVIGEEIGWQLQHASRAAVAALLKLPPVGLDRSGPLGPGLLSTGQLGAIVSEIQSKLVAVSS